MDELKPTDMTGKYRVLLCKYGYAVGYVLGRTRAVWYVQLLPSSITSVFIQSCTGLLHENAKIVFLVESVDC